MIATVQELIDALNRIEDRSSTICMGAVGKILPIESIDVEPITNRVIIWPDCGE